MTQQVPPPPSKLRKGFLVVGIVLLIFGFSFFYLASRVSLDYVTTYNYNVNLNSPESGNVLWDSGTLQTYFAVPQYVVMEPDDFLTVSYTVPNLANGTVYILLGESIHTEEFLGYSPIINQTVAGWLGFKNYQSYEITVAVFLATLNAQNVTIPTTTILHHYERPQWFYFGVGVALSSLAMIPIFKSKK